MFQSWVCGIIAMCLQDAFGLLDEIDPACSCPQVELVLPDEMTAWELTLAAGNMGSWARSCMLLIAWEFAAGKSDVHWPAVSFYDSSGASGLNFSEF